MFGNGSCDEYDVSVSRVILKLCPNSLNVESWGKDGCDFNVAVVAPTAVCVKYPW